MEAAGATAEEAEFLCGDGLEGQRIELNAMDSQQFIDWLEEKLKAAGVTKVIPNYETLQAAYRRALLVARANKRLAEVQAEWNANGNSEVAIPPGLSEQIEALITGTNHSWDEAILEVAAERSELPLACNASDLSVAVVRARIADCSHQQACALVLFRLPQTTIGLAVERRL